MICARRSEVLSKTPVVMETLLLHAEDENLTETERDEALLDFARTQRPAQVSHGSRTETTNTHSRMHTRTNAMLPLVFLFRARVSCSIMYVNVCKISSTSGAALVT